MTDQGRAYATMHRRTAAVAFGAVILALPAGIAIGISGTLAARSPAPAQAAPAINTQKDLLECKDRYVWAVRLARSMEMALEGMGREGREAAEKVRARDAESQEFVRRAYPSP